jgi:hypothetical protein
MVVLTVCSLQVWCEELLPYRTDVPDAMLDERFIYRAPIELETSPNNLRSLRIEQRFKEQINLENSARVKRMISDDDRRQILARVKLIDEGRPIKDDKSEKTPWRELFSGKDMAGWKTIGSAIWKVENGEMIGGQFGDPKRSGVIRTAESFQDFELELEFQIDEHGKYNSGVYLRNDPDTAARTGYQVNIGRGAAGEYCGGVYTTEWLAKGDETDTVRKPKEWNALRILAKGAHIQVELNGKKIVDMADPKPDPKFLQKGVIGFQTYGAEGHDGWVKFRKIRVRELK